MMGQTRRFMIAGALGAVALLAGGLDAEAREAPAKAARDSRVQPVPFTAAGSGECRVPASWRVLYKVGEEWKPVEVAGSLGVDKDRYNKVAFAPVTTSGLRPEVVLPKEWSAGIQEWKVR